MPAQSAPPMRPPTRATSMCRPQGRSKPNPIQPATDAAMSIWPRPPMLNMPTRNARATPRPPAMSGVANVSVSVSGRMPAMNVVAPEVVDRPLEQGRRTRPATESQMATSVSPGRAKKYPRGLLHALVGERDHDGADEQREQHREHRDDRVAGRDLVEHGVPARRRRHVGARLRGSAGSRLAPRPRSPRRARRRRAPRSRRRRRARASPGPGVPAASGCWGSLMRRLLLRGVRRPSSGRARHGACRRARCRRCGRGT